MKSFTLYEILSFLIPGFVLVSLLSFVSKEIHLDTIFSYENNLSSNIIMIGLSIFFGVLLQFASELLKKSEFYKKHLYKHISVIVNDSDLLKVKLLPFLKNEYQRIRDYEVDEIDGYPKYLFDFAYYYLEVNDKIRPSKAMQSFYYFFRNLVLVSLIYLTIIFIIMLTSIFIPLNFSISFIIWSFVLAFFAFFLLVGLTKYMREKFVTKILWSYYVDRRHILNDK